MMPLTTADHCVALIDIGNTRMKIGWVNPATGAREPTALALEHKHINHLIAWFGEQNVRPGTAVGVNVAGGSKAQAIEKLLQDSFNASVHWLRSQPQAAGVLNRYTDTAQLGADRWIAMIGLSQIHPDATTPLLLASFGTATTLDTLCPAGAIASTAASSANKGAHSPLPDTVNWVFDGGLIFPGPGMMRSSLANNTAQLPEANGTTTLFPTDTHRAITTGIAAAQGGALVRQWQAGLSRYGIAPRVYGTGGGWPAIQEEAQRMLAMAQRQNNLPEQPIQHLASPILDGLARMAIKWVSSTGNHATVGL